MLNPSHRDVPSTGSFIQDYGILYVLSFSLRSIGLVSLARVAPIMFSVP